MENQSSSGLLLPRKRRRDGSNGETEEGEKLGKIPRCTVVSQLCASVLALHVGAALAIYLCTVCPCMSGCDILRGGRKVGT